MNDFVYVYKNTVSIECKWTTCDKTGGTFSPKKIKDAFSAQGTKGGCFIKIQGVSF